MKKNKIYKIYKFSTTRLCRSKYKIKIDYSQAVINKEVVDLASSQVLRKIRELCHYKDEDDFISEYISIKVDNKSHYKKIKNIGVTVNGHKYVRFICGAGNGRSSTVFMIREDLFEPMFEIMCCGVKPDKMVLAKWNAYFALNASSSYIIPEPNVCVVKDYTVNLKHRFDFVHDDLEDKFETYVEEKELEIKDYPVWDGMGCMSVEYAKQINQTLELGYIPSTMIIRNSFIKGCICTMDFKDFSKEFKVSTITDIWGKEYNINDIDLILTESQFKMYKMYNSWQEYVDYSHKYNLKWGCVKCSHEIDDTHTFTNYQFLQVLDLSDEQIIELCQPTIDWIRDVTGGNIYKLLLYFLGNKNKIDINNIRDYDIKALLYNHGLLNDNYIKTRIMRSLNKKIRQAYSGKLLIDGNFSFMLNDPFAFLQYVTGLEVTGLLNEYEYYNGFWNKRKTDKVVAMRSPLTFASEVNILNLKNNKDTDRWYKYISSCCTVYNIYGDDTFKHADSDRQNCPLTQ